MIINNYSKTFIAHATGYFDEEKKKVLWDWPQLDILLREDVDPDQVEQMLLRPFYLFLKEKL